MVVVLSATLTPPPYLQQSPSSPTPTLYLYLHARVQATDNTTAYNVVHLASVSGLSGPFAVTELISIAPSVPLYSIAGRTEPPSGHFVLYASTPAHVFRYDTSTSQLSVLVTAPVGHFYRGVVLAPYSVAMVAPTPFATQSRTPSSSTTPSASPTASVTASATNSRHADAFHATSVLVLRLGDGSVATPSTGIALPLFLDEVDTTGEEAPTSVVQSIALPLSVSLAMGSTSGVAPGSSQWFDTEGFPTSFASDNSAIVVSCYSVPPGSPILDSNTTIKVVGVVRADGSMDFSSTATVFPWYGRDGFQVALRNAVTSDGSSYWLAGSPGACGYTDVSSTCLSKGGIFHVPLVATSVWRAAQRTSPPHQTTLATTTPAPWASTLASCSSWARRSTLPPQRGCGRSVAASP